MNSPKHYYDFFFDTLLLEIKQENPQACVSPDSILFVVTYYTEETVAKITNRLPTPQTACETEMPPGALISDFVDKCIATVRSHDDLRKVNYGANMSTVFGCGIAESFPEFSDLVETGQKAGNTSLDFYDHVIGKRLLVHADMFPE